MEAKESRKINHVLSKVFEEIVDHNDKDNIIVTSPLSLFTCFAMLAEGLSGTTFKELDKIFEFDDKKILDDDVFASLQRLLNDYKDEHAEIKMTNCLYTNKNIKIKKEYIETVQKKYSAFAESIDFSDAKAIKIINEKISKSTNDNVKKAIDKLSPYAFSVVINTLYFKCLWRQPFNKDNNIEEDFIVEGGEKHKCEFMVNRSMQVTVKHHDHYSYLCIPYQSENFKFVVEMANDSNLKDTHPNRVMELANSKKEETYEVFLPKFKGFSSCDVDELLKEMGVKKLFSANKDFNKITDHQMCLSEIVHNAVIQVDEEGVEVSLFTFATVEGDISSGVTTPQFVVNRPFYFHIVETKEDLILVSGYVGLPEF